MKKVAKAPKVLEVVGITGIQRSLERIQDLLTKIKKALVEYLDRQRMSFPRFYFVGDDDLLDIIGNSKNLMQIQKHFKKMFAGISSLILDAEQKTVAGFLSGEGEEVKLPDVLTVASHATINDLLAAVEREMKRTLAKLLHQCMGEAAAFNVAIDGPAYLAWVAKYPAQIIVIAAQVLWSQATEEAIRKMNGDGSGMKFQLDALQGIEASIEGILSVLADAVLEDHHPIMRKKLENLVSFFVPFD